jgi:hypothetical protein
MSEPEARHQADVDATSDARRAALSTFGTVSDDVLTFLINPMFTGGPPWPNTRQAYSTTQGQLAGEERVLIASDALSDPFDDSWDGAPRVQGFGLEAYAIGSPEAAARDGWLLPLVQQAAMQFAHHQGVAGLLERMGVISMELWDVPIPEEHRTAWCVDEERVGVLIGATHPAVPDHFDGPLGRVRLVHLMLLSAEETRAVVQGGPDARNAMAEAIRSRPDGLVSRFDRESLV